MNIIEKLKKHPKHYFSTQNGVLLCGNCMDIINEIPDNCIDLILTDPPFGKVCYRGINGIGSKKNLNRSYASMIDWGKCKKPAISQIKKIIGKGKNYIVWGGNYFLEAFPSTNCFLIWDKQGEWPDTCFAGVELAITSFTGVARKYTCRNQGWVKDSNDGKIEHPTPKPSELFAWCITKFTKPGDIIFDPYSGSGTTAVVCERLNRKWICIDISKQYCELSKQRILKEVNQLKFNFK